MQPALQYKQGRGEETDGRTHTSTLSRESSFLEADPSQKMKTLKVKGFSPESLRGSLLM